MTTIITKIGDKNVDPIKRMITMAERERSEVTRLRDALERIVVESPPDTAYSWCQTKLARCNEIARNALADPSAVER